MLLKIVSDLKVHTISINMIKRDLRDCKEELKTLWPIVMFTNAIDEYIYALVKDTLYLNRIIEFTENTKDKFWYNYPDNLTTEIK